MGSFENFARGQLSWKLERERKFCAAKRAPAEGSGSDSKSAEAMQMRAPSGAARCRAAAIARTGDKPAGRRATTFCGPSSGRRRLRGLPFYSTLAGGGLISLRRFEPKKGGEMFSHRRRRFANEQGCDSATKTRAMKSRPSQPPPQPTTSRLPSAEDSPAARVECSRGGGQLESCCVVCGVAGAHFPTDASWPPPAPPKY